MCFKDKCRSFQVLKLKNSSIKKIPSSWQAKALQRIYFLIFGQEESTLDEKESTLVH